MLEEKVNLRAMIGCDRDDPTLCMYSFQIWPIPASVTKELTEHLKQAAAEFLGSRGVTALDEPVELPTIQT